MRISHQFRRVALSATAGLLATPFAAAAAGFRVALIEKAAGIPTTAQGVAKFVATAQSLVTPALAITAAIAPLALIAGGLLVLLGSRRGWQIILTSIGVLLLLGSVTALID